MQWFETDSLMQWAQTESGLYVPAAPEPKQVYAIDLFCGAGGFSLGFEAAGVDVVAALEHWPIAVCTYLHNLGHREGCAVGYVTDKDKKDMDKAIKRAGFEGKNWIGQANPNRAKSELGCRAMLVGDASQAKGQQLLELLALRGFHHPIDVVIGGPPCQGMSQSNSKRSPSDPRNNLVLEFVRLAGELGASMFVMENVPPLLTDKKFAPLRDALFEKAHEMGFSNISANILDAANYGVPQFRRRAFIIGTKDAQRHFSFPMPVTWGLRVRDGQLLCDHLSSRGLDGEPYQEADDAGQLEMF